MRREEGQLAFETIHQPDRNALQLPPSFVFPLLSAWLAQTRIHLPFHQSIGLEE